MWKYDVNSIGFEISVSIERYFVFPSTISTGPSLADPHKPTSVITQHTTHSSIQLLHSNLYALSFLLRIRLNRLLHLRQHNPLLRQLPFPLLPCLPFRLPRQPRNTLHPAQRIPRRRLPSKIQLRPSIPPSPDDAAP